MNANKRKKNLDYCHPGRSEVEGSYAVLLIKSCGSRFFAFAQNDITY